MWRARKLRFCTAAAVLSAVAGSAVLVSSATGSTFPGANGKLTYAVWYSYRAGGYISTVNPNGRRATRISKFRSKVTTDFQPRFSADGTKVVFVHDPRRRKNDRTQIWIAGASGHGPHQVRITGLPKGSYAVGPTFTPDGKSLVFEIDKRLTPIGIWKVAAAGGKAVPVEKEFAYDPTVSPDGTTIAFLAGSETRTLVIANIDGSDPQILYTVPQDTAAVGSPDFSPDGKTIVFMQYGTTTGLGDIWTIAVDGSANGTGTELTSNTKVSAENPVYSPDGTEIAFFAVNPATDATSIDVMSAAGGAPSVVVKARHGTIVRQPDWGIAPAP